MKKLFLFLLFILTSYFSNAQVITTLSTVGSNIWNVPCGVTSVTVQVWGGGGGDGGGGASNGQGGGGGGGGGFSTSTTFTVTSAGIITYTVGAGGTGGNQANGTAGGASQVVSGTTTLTANGGGFGGVYSGGTGTAGAGGAGSTSTGGNGAIGNASGSGGGGEGACSTAPLNGTNASAQTGGANACNGGNGGNGVTTNNGPGGNGAAPGGGGGGATRTSTAGNGGNGQIIISYTQPLTVNAGVDQTLATCATTTTNLAATAIGTAGWTGSWSCIGCTGITITTPTLATTGVTGFAAGAVYVFQWIATNTSGCTITDEMVVTVPACAQANNNCSSATSLTIGSSLLCGQNTTGFNTEASECVTVTAPPSTYQTAWYRFTATNDSLVLNFLTTSNTTPISPIYHLFGPFAAGAGCVPGCGSLVTAGTLPAVGAGNGEFGGHLLFTGLTTTGNNQYLISIEGYANVSMQYCISVAEPAYNSVAPANALVISNCGAAFTGTTNGGYYANTANLDGNLATQVAGAGVAGGDVTYAVNNLSWFKFCSANAGTYSVQFDVLSCLFSSALNSGSQMAILTGTNNNMTNVWQATNPTTVSTPIQTSPSFTLAAGGCAYLVVDGWNGDACAYSYVLTNITGGCILLPVSVVEFTGAKIGRVNEINWSTASEQNSDYFIVERSKDGIIFENMTKVQAAGNSNSLIKYKSIDDAPYSEGTYYRLLQSDFNGEKTNSGIIYIANEIDVLSNLIIDYNESGQTDFTYYSSKYSSGSIEIINTTGSVIIKKNVEVQSGKNKEKINNSSLASGIYFVKLTVNGKTNIQKFIIY